VRDSCLKLLVTCSLLGTLACTPPTEPQEDTPEPWFQEDAAARGLTFVHRSGHDGRYLMPEAAAGGGGLFDMDNDGDLDAYLVQSGSLTDPAKRTPGNQLFENLGDGRFREVQDSGAGAGSGYGMGVACGDVDDDGDVDLYVTNFGPNTLLLNDGSGKFVDATDVAGVGHDGWGTSAGFFDYDRDGDLDLFVANYLNWQESTELDCANPMGEPDYCSPLNYDSPSMDTLYRNDGEGRFTDVTVAAGLDAGFGNGLGFVFGDFSGDDWLDIFVANDGIGDQLWVNQQDGTFIDRALVAGVAVDLEGGVPKAGMGVTAGDVDDDGDLDLMVCNLVDETDSVYRNEGEYFSDVTARTGLGLVSRRYTRFGLGWVDFDLDGEFDLFQANGKVMRSPSSLAEDGFAEINLLFKGRDQGSFDEVLPRGGTTEPLIAASRAAAFGDIDDDGAPDILVVNKDQRAHLLMNVHEDVGNWVRFRVLERSGRDAEGAVLFASVGDHTERQDVRSGYSYLACNDPRVTFGLGEATKIDALEILWVDGTRQTLGAFDVNQTHTIQRD